MVFHTCYILLMLAASQVERTKAKASIAVLLVNLGTPKACDLRSVRRYLREFLMDGRVTDVPWLLRFLLVYGIIAPCRGPVSLREYRKLWTERGSPLWFYTRSLAERLQGALGSRYLIRYAMRYQSPALSKVLEELRQRPLSQLILLPLYPQYASATTGSAVEFVLRKVQQWQRVPSFSVMDQFHLRSAFLSAWAERASPYLAQSKQWDAFLFSYHGLPERHILRASLRNHCQLNSCCEQLCTTNRYCYRAQCFQTTAAIAKRLQLPTERCRTTFQSRLGKAPWIQPYTDHEIRNLAEEGIKRLLVFSPSFVADCLETTIEIGETYRDLFLKEGGELLQLVPSLNDSTPWIKALQSWVQEQATSSL